VGGGDEAPSSSAAAFRALPLSVQQSAQVVWDYMQMGHLRYFDYDKDEKGPNNGKPWKADAVIALGSNDLRVASRAAELYREGFGARLVLTGGVGALTAGLYGGDSEAEAFAKVAEAQGIPRGEMLLEGASTNTGENMQFSFSMLREDSLHWQRYPLLRHAVLVQKPFMERRTWATFLKQWPATPVPRIFVTSPQVSLQEYATGAPGLTHRDIIATMMGDLQRIAIYPAKGFQEYQEIPIQVWSALKTLIEQGFALGDNVDQLILIKGKQKGSMDPSDYEGLGGAEPPLPPEGFVPTEVQ